MPLGSRSQVERPAPTGNRHCQHRLVTWVVPVRQDISINDQTQIIVLTAEGPREKQDQKQEAGVFQSVSSLGPGEILPWGR